MGLMEGGRRTRPAVLEEDAMVFDCDLELPIALGFGRYRLAEKGLLQAATIIMSVL